MVQLPSDIHCMSYASRTTSAFHCIILSPVPVVQLPSVLHYLNVTYTSSITSFCPSWHYSAIMYTCSTTSLCPSLYMIFIMNFSSRLQLPSAFHYGIVITYTCSTTSLCPSLYYINNVYLQYDFPLFFII